MIPRPAAPDPPDVPEYQWRALFEQRVQEVLARGWGTVSVEIVQHKVKWVDSKTREEVVSPENA